MKAIGADRVFTLDEGNLFYEYDRDIPEPQQYELLVQVKAISVNPVIRNYVKQRLQKHRECLGLMR